MNGAEAAHVESNLQAAHPWPIWLVLVAIAAVVVLVIAIYMTEQGRPARIRRTCAAAARVMLLLLVGWMLLGWTWIRYTSELPRLVVVLDRSSSMSTVDGATESIQTHRLERAVDLLYDASQAQRSRLEQRYRVEFYSLAEALEQLSGNLSQRDSVAKAIAPDGTYSRIGDALVRLVQRSTGTGTAAIVLYSDGINNAGDTLAEAARTAREAAIPVYAVAMGKRYAQPDVRITDLLVEREVFLGDRIAVEALVSAQDLAVSTTELRLVNAASGEVLDRQKITLSEEQGLQSATLSFVPQEAGNVALRVEVEPVTAETEEENNSATTEVVVLNQSIRVLMVFQRPSYEFRFLKSFLQRTKQQDGDGAALFQLDCVLQDADADFVREDENAVRLVPTDAEILNGYDAFIFGDIEPNLVRRGVQEAIVDAVVTGGAGCVFVHGVDVAGKRLAGWPLQGLLPVSFQTNGGDKGFGSDPFSLQPTSIGMSALPLQLTESSDSLIRLWGLLPPAQRIAYAESVRPGAQVLVNTEIALTGRTAPLLVTQFAGAGRVAWQGFDETFQWTSLAGSDLYHQRYWGQMLRWVSRGRLGGERTELHVDPLQARFGQTIHFRLTLGKSIEAGASVELEIASDGAPSQVLRLQREPGSARSYLGSKEDLPPANYRATVRLSDVAAETYKDFLVSAPPTEQAVLRPDLEAMRELASQSRGRFYTEEEASNLLGDLPPGTRTKLGTLPPKPIWNSWPVALIFLTLLTGEWLLRRSCRML